ncbi:hypothetical protein ACQR2B_27970 [Bradyrhizobium oligotrophicum]|uniref:hypothetical protein n=1 Tax=Bradyrhizobium TaxID=374 RepID=UPI001557FB7B|nr:hypothetical protein [Bradyrhizobium aeschynomenes]NPU10926.1 hypothetical protein [Bradyrhizobium aeschynomenes]
MLSVVAHGRAMEFSGLSQGTWFLQERNGKRTFGLAIKGPTGRMDALVFPEGEPPQVQLAGHPYAVFGFDDAIMRPDLDSLHFGPSQLGDLISADKSFHLTVASPDGDRYTANLTAGEQRARREGPYASFSSWSVGVLRGQEWIPLYTHGVPPSHAS